MRCCVILWWKAIGGRAEFESLQFSKMQGGRGGADAYVDRER